MIELIRSAIGGVRVLIHAARTLADPNYLPEHGYRGEHFVDHEDNDDSHWGPRVVRRVDPHETFDEVSLPFPEPSCGIPGCESSWCNESAA